MDTQRAIATKRDTRSYRPDPLADDELDAVLRAARMAGSAKNSQVTRIVVVTDADDRARLAECGDFTGWIHTAPCTLVLAGPTEQLRLFDLGRMAQNAMLAAHDLGLATCPVTFQHQDRIRPLLGIPAEVEAPMGVVLGHPGPPDPNRVGSPRIALDDLVRHGRW
ncbi:MAG TPA: nitroreductase family protein [Acidimicrobiales bacterium]|nr:nitroreductase family protein [Acidimicrobiales bacterium]